MSEAMLKQTIAIVTALDTVLIYNGIEPGTQRYDESKHLFAKTMGETLGRIEIDQITREVAKAEPYQT
jgi:hypothetical protein